MTNRIAIWPALLLVLLLAGCANRPFQVAPSGDARAALPPEARKQIVLGRFDYDPRPKAIGVCYGSFFNKPQQVMGVARDLCPNEGRIERVDEDTFWNGCGLLQPIRASFICFPGQEPKIETQ